MNRPTIILHMVTTPDGKITGAFLNDPTVQALCEDYYRIHREYAADAYLCGRITFEGSFTFGRQPSTQAFAGHPVDSGDYVACHADKYAVVIDTHGRLGWTDHCIHDDDPGYDAAHIIEVVTEQTPKAYLAYLRSLSVSYLICGETQVDPLLLCEKLFSLFGIRKLMLEGGGITDSLFLQAGLVDEMSLVMVPMIDGTAGLSLFEQKQGGTLSFTHTKAVPLSHGGIWLSLR